MGVNSYTSVFPIPQAIPVLKFRSLSLLVFILLTFKIFNLFNSDYNLKITVQTMTSQTDSQFLVS